MPLLPEQKAKLEKKLGGRPKGSKTKKRIAVELARQYVIKRVVQKLEPLLDAQLDLALGHKVLKTDSKTGAIIEGYLRSPDKEAGKYLLDQSIGKAKETVELLEEVRLKLDI